VIITGPARGGMKLKSDKGRHWMRGDAGWNTPWRAACIYKMWSDVNGKERALSGGCMRKFKKQLSRGTFNGWPPTVGEGDGTAMGDNLLGMSEKTMKRMGRNMNRKSGNSGYSLYGSNRSQPYPGQEKHSSKATSAAPPRGWG